MRAPNATPAFLALDQGGSASRARVFDARGQLWAGARVDVGHQRPRPGWVEQDPEALVQSLVQAAAMAVTSLDRSQRGALQSAGLVCQRSSVVAWDAQSGAALSPVLSWQDTRAADWLAAQPLDVEAVRARTGLYPNAHFGLSKLRWLLEYNDAVQHAAGQGRLRFGPLAAFLAHRLLRERPLKVDPANASRTLLLDLARGDWCDATLHQFGFERDWLPVVVASDADYGHLPLPGGELPLRLLSGDQSAAAFAFGAPVPEAGYVNLGTGAFVYRLAHAVSGPAVLGAALPTPARLLRSVIHWSEQPQFVMEGTVNGAGSALAWFNQKYDHAAVDAVDEWPVETYGLPLFLNGIGGLGSPDWQPDFASRFIGSGTVAAQRIAVAESIVFLLQRNLECLQECAPLAGLVATGGLSGSEAFCQWLADLSGLTVQRPADCEASARGAACLLAGQPSGWLNAPARYFHARPNAALQGRYRQWTQHMDEALAHHGRQSRSI